MLAAQVNRGESLVWLIGAMVCLLAAPWVQLSVSTGNEDDHIMRCRPVSHFRDCKVLLVTSLTHVSGTIASVQTFTFFTLSASFQKNCRLVGRLGSGPCLVADGADVVPAKRPTANVVFTHAVMLVC